MANTNVTMRIDETLKAQLQDMNETPNIETLKAMAETEYLINHPEVRKTYDDVDKMMEDILG